ncbi:cytoskeletal protein Sojo-like [Hyperolius riggenbachi]|uniref:cytoskeletal protein Sojo-like n=1 Tax=Hyperolius riggenbachi TaxID=752182 RepID=UPI0035A2AEFC
MTARLRSYSKADSQIPSDLVTLPHLRHSFHNSRTKTSERLPSIAGVGLGIQDVKASSSAPFNKAAKSIPRTFRAEKLPQKNVVSKEVQVSINEDNGFLSKIEALEKENLFLRSSLRQKEDMVAELNKSIKNKTMQFARDIELEVNSHKTTRQLLERSQGLVEEKEQLLQERILHYEHVSRELQSQYEETLASLREQSKTEIAARDEKIDKLKHQISELFKDKSWEHQKQMEELQKEMTRLAEEAQLLRTQLKRERISKQECDKCKAKMAALEDIKVQLKLKNRTIDELQSLCQRFENQLQEQEKIRHFLWPKPAEM